MKHTRETGFEVGLFDLGDGNQLSGTLRLAGPRTRLSLYSKQDFIPITAPDLFIRGSLKDLTKVSLIDCISPGAGTITKGSERSYFADVFPHFVVAGMQYLCPKDQTITCASFVIDDAATLFYDFDAFGTVIDARPLIREVVSANKLDREIPIGDDPQIHYFTGKRVIFQANTSIGHVSAHHSLSWSFPGPHGIRVDNQIRVTVDFSTPQRIHSVINHISILRDYFGLLVGRPQNLKLIQIQVRNDPDQIILLDVHWSHRPTRKASTREQPPHPADVLMDAVRRPEEFSTALANWLERQPRWRDARYRFFGLFAEQRNYDIDRLIGSANMFDILPLEAVPAAVQLSQELIDAQTKAQALFKQLDESPERHSVLGALGRIRKPNLKRKVRFRAQKLLDVMPDIFPDLIWLTERAVDCRNYFVHGGDPPLDYSDNEQIIWFFADTLEFIFATSDLIEAGWDINAWHGRSSVSHPFGRYIRVYGSQLAAVRVVANKRRKITNP